MTEFDDDKKERLEDVLNTSFCCNYDLQESRNFCFNFQDLIKSVIKPTNKDVGDPIYEKWNCLQCVNWITYQLLSREWVNTDEAKWNKVNGKIGEGYEIVNTQIDIDIKEEDKMGYFTISMHDIFFMSQTLHALFFCLHCF